VAWAGETEDIIHSTSISSYKFPSIKDLNMVVYLIFMARYVKQIFSSFISRIRDRIWYLANEVVRSML